MEQDREMNRWAKKAKCSTSKSSFGWTWDVAETKYAIF